MKHADNPIWCARNGFLTPHRRFAVPYLHCQRKQRCLFQFLESRSALLAAISHRFGKNKIYNQSLMQTEKSLPESGDDRVVRWCWVNFLCRGVLLIWVRVGQGSTALAVGAGGGYLDIFSVVYHFSFLSPSLWETVRYRLKYCLKGPLSPKQPTNQPTRG